MMEVLASLLLYAQVATGYAVPSGAPDVVFLPHGELARLVCHKPCPVYGWYREGRAIYLDDRLDPVHDPEARAILLHELVHYLQQSAGAFGDDVACERWMRRERQAYQVQARWLMENRVFALAYGGAGRAPWALACRDGAAAADG